MIDRGHNPSDHELRIALVTSRFSPRAGGVEGQVLNLAGALAADGHQVSILTHDIEDGAPAYEVVDGAAVHRFLPLLAHRRDLLSPGMARHLARGEAAYDVVHVHGCDAPAEAVAGWWEGPLVVSPHLPGGRASRMRVALDAARRSVGHQVAARAALVLCDSESERRAFTEAFPDAAPTTIVVPPGVEAARLRAARSAPGDGRRLVLAVARLDAEARLDVLISAMSLLGPGHRLEICGDGPERPALERQVVQLGLTSVVRFRGVIADRDLTSSISAAGCFVSLSDHVSRGIGVLEAAVVGTPAVAASTPAHVEARERAGEVITLVPETGSTRLLTESIRRAALARWFPVDLPGWAEVSDRVADGYRDAIEGRARTHQPA